MAWNFEKGKPIYSQIVERFRKNIASGVYQPGQRIKSVRDLAVEAGVNPNTMQRALSELEREGLLYSERTAGRIVTSDKDKISGISRDMVTDIAEQFIRNMRDSGISDEEILSIVRQILQEGQKS